MPRPHRRRLRAHHHLRPIRCPPAPHRGPDPGGRLLPPPDPRLALLFFTALALTVILQVLLLFGAGSAFLCLSGLAARAIITALSLVGTPVHERSHALASLLTLSRVAVVKLQGDEAGVGSRVPAVEPPERDRYQPGANLFRPARHVAGGPVHQPRL